MSDITEWLSSLALDRYASAFAEAEIELNDLRHLSGDDLKDLGLPLGPRRRVEAAIKMLDADADAVTATVKRVDPLAAPSSPEQAQATPSEAERRQLTVMFVDLVGSTQMANQLDAEDMRGVITGYQNTVARLVSRNDGFIARYMGDGVLCYFGWPRANEDDAERAVRAGLEIISQIQRSVAPANITLATRVGIATGVVIVGDLIGSGAAQEAAVVGETPNLAARLQGLARPNQLIVAQETQSLLGNVFDLTLVSEQQLKGISAPVDTYLVNGETSPESRFDARQTGSLTPIIGRERELQLMRECWALARSGTGQLLIVSGEAGIGKSRITRAVIDEMERDDHIRMTYQCSPYHPDSAFYPVIQQMLFAAGINQPDTADERLDKIEALLGADNDALKFVAPMMGLDGEARYGKLDLTPAQQRARTMQALTGLLVEQARDKPLLLVYEDLHWIDPTSLELMDLLLDAIAEQPIMILATARPTFEYGFGGHPIVTRFALNRLGKDQIGAIVSKLTDGKTLPDEIMEIIASRTDGVPLFVEELTKTILESGALKEESNRLVLDGPLSTIAIPTTLHDSLMARLDRLQPIKEVAQTAACIGREFSHGLLAHVSHLANTELTTALDGLIEAELIYRRGLPPEATYLFKHALVRDAAYESLLKEKRRAVHTRILTAMEADPDVAPEVLAVHAEEANLTDRAIDLWETAGKAAIARPAFDEGMVHLRHAIALLKPKVDGGDRNSLERCLAMQTQLGFASMARNGWGDNRTKATLEQALELADRVGETPLRFQILYGLMTTRYLRGDNVEAVHHGQIFVDLAENAPDTAPAVVANRSFAISLMFNGQFKRAQPYFDRALDLFDPVLHNDLAQKYGQDFGVATHGLISVNLLMLGETRRAIKLVRECERYAEACGDITSKCYMHMVAAYFHLYLHDFAEMERHTRSLTELVNQYSLSFFGNLAAMFQSLLKVGSGDRTGLAELKEVDASLVAANSLGLLTIFRAVAGHRALAMGLNEEALQFANSTQELITQTGEEWYLVDLHRLYAALATADDDAKGAEQQLNTALDVARKQGAKFSELGAAIDLARLMQEQERTDEAIAILKPVSDSIAEGDCPHDQAMAKELLNVLTG
ncbi:MAG: AAA family ATPase [Chromatiales bacterium]|nr:AAA family ATPase [Chromatiales bacterium]